MLMDIKHSKEKLSKIVQSIGFIEPMLINLLFY